MATANEKALQRAIQAGGGSQAALAGRLGIRQGQIANWIHRDRQVPLSFLDRVSKATGLSARELRPDLAKLFACDCEGK